MYLSTVIFYEAIKWVFDNYRTLNIVYILDYFVNVKLFLGIQAPSATAGGKAK